MARVDHPVSAAGTGFSGGGRGVGVGRDKSSSEQVTESYVNFFNLLLLEIQ